MHQILKILSVICVCVCVWLIKTYFLKGEHVNLFKIPFFFKTRTLETLKKAQLSAILETKHPPGSTKTKQSSRDLVLLISVFPAEACGF